MGQKAFITRSTRLETGGLEVELPKRNEATDGEHSESGFVLGTWLDCPDCGLATASHRSDWACMS